MKRRLGSLEIVEVAELKEKAEEPDGICDCLALLNLRPILGDRLGCALQPVQKVHVPENINNVFVKEVRTLTYSSCGVGRPSGSLSIHF